MKNLENALKKVLLKEVNRSTKVKIYKNVFVPVLTFGASSKSSLTSAKIKVLKIIEGEIAN